MLQTFSTQKANSKLIITTTTTALYRLSAYLQASIYLRCIQVCSNGWIWPLSSPFLASGRHTVGLRVVNSGLFANRNCRKLYLRLQSSNPSDSKPHSAPLEVIHSRVYLDHPLQAGLSLGTTIVKPFESFSINTKKSQLPQAVSFATDL
jgi:hypothetical protein